MNFRHFLTTCLLLAAFPILSYADALPFVAAHRGGHISGFIPENSIAGVASAKRFGYTAIECDPQKTADGVIVVMHDKTINRTMRLNDGYRKIEGDVFVADCNFEELRSKYVLASGDPSQRAQIPTLEELALECKRLGMKMMLHSGMLEAGRTIHRLLGDDWICFSSNIDMIVKMRAEGFKGLCLYSTKEKDAATVINTLRNIDGPVGISSMDLKKKDPHLRQYTPEYIRSLTSAGFEVQSSIFRTPWEVLSVKDGVSMVLTDFYWLQQEGRSARETWIAPSRRMVGGKVFEKRFEPLTSYGAILLELKFKGNVNVVVNGHSYEFVHASMQKEIIGIRLYKDVPSFRIEAAGGVRINEMRAGTFAL